MIGTRLGPYEITAKLGAGGMGEVYRATDSKLKRDVAIKVLPAAFVADPERLARFEREAQLLAQLQHPHIASIYGLEESGGTRALVMELVEGPTLAERLSGGALALDESIAISRQIAEALEAAHERGIVHRDLKPANVKLTTDGRVKVLDFGLAKALDSAAGLAASASNSPTLMNSPTLTAAGTALGVILGTAAYMSPEQARGKAVDKRADIWAFGAVLFEMLAGRRLFDGETLSDTLAGVIKGELDFSQLPAETPAPIRLLLRRCLERDPRNRLHDIADARIVIAEVERGVRTDPELPAVVGAGARAASWRGVIAGVAIGAALGAGAMTLWPRGERAGAPVEPISVRTLTHSGADDRPSVSPDGKLVAFVSRRSGAGRIWIKELASGGEQPLSSGPDDAPRFSPDGAQLLFARREGQGTALYRQPLVGGQAQKLVDGAQEGDWSPDGERVAFVRFGDPATTQSSLCVAEVRSGASECWWTSEQSLFSPRFSPDGKELVAVEAASAGNTADYRIVRLRRPEGAELEVQAVTVSGPRIGPLTWAPPGRRLIYAQAGNIVGDDSDALSRVVLFDLDSGTSRTLFYGEHFFPTAGGGAFGSAAGFSPAGPGRLIYAVQPVRERLWSGRMVRETADDSVDELALLTSTEGRDRQPTYSPDGRSILFSSNRSGNLDLWLLERSSGTFRQLTDDRAQDWDPAFTADGEGLLWSSDRGGHFEIWTARLDGTERRQLSRDGRDAENPVASPDGRFVYYWSAHPERAGVWRMNADGSDARHLVAGPYFFPEVSPDGRYISYLAQEPQRLRSLILFSEAATGAAVPFRIETPAIVPGAPVNIGRHRWSADGWSILYLGLDADQRIGIYAQEFLSDRPPTKLAGFRADFFSESLAISPDGREIVIAGLEIRQRLLLAENVPEVGAAASSGR